MSRRPDKPQYVVQWHDHPYDGWVLHHVHNGRVDPNPAEGVANTLDELLVSLDAMRSAVVAAQRRQ